MRRVSIAVIGVTYRRTIGMCRFSNEMSLSHFLCSLRPNVAVEGASLVINHQINRYPGDRAADAYFRPEFLQSLTIPVVTTVVLFDNWRRRDYEALRTAVFDSPTGYSAAVSLPAAVDAEPPRRSWWRSRRGR